MRHPRASLGLCLLALLASVSDVRAQEVEVEAAVASQALRVFIDCRGFRFCDRDFYVREIAFINHTRDREDAQVHVLITGQQTGAGGQRISIDFIGRDEFEGLEDRLGVTAPPAEAIEQVMTQIARQIQLGLARYIARTDQSQVMRLQADEDAPAPEVATPEDDPWNFWTFEVSASGFLFGQERQQFFFGNTDFEARRVTEGSRLELGAGFNYSESNFDTSDTTTVTSITRGYDANVLFVLSAGEHWGWGGQLAAAHSTFSNEDLTIRLAPAIEYNVFPYSESTRRQLRFVYSVGVTRLDYTEETIFFKTEETVPDHRFAAALEVRQPWGSSRASFQVVQHLDDLSRHRINFNGGVDLRVIKGLSLGINGGVSRVRDQINLAALGASEEEILTRQRELETGFEYDFNVRFSYTFGSIFSNVVNPRLGGRNEFFLRNF